MPTPPRIALVSAVLLRLLLGVAAQAAGLICASVARDTGFGPVLIILGFAGLALNVQRSFDLLGLGVDREMAAGPPRRTPSRSEN